MELHYTDKIQPCGQISVKIKGIHTSVGKKQEITAVKNLCSNDLKSLSQSA